MQAIKKRDLSLGNYIADKWNPNLYCQVTKLYKNHEIIGYEANDGTKLSANIENVIGIQLTEELLLKCPQFKKTDDYGDQIYYECGQYYLCFDHDDIAFGRNGIDGYTCLIYDEEHLQSFHQLQNLIHSLTHTELTINF